jgi:hypothetical protein
MKPHRPAFQCFPGETALRLIRRERAPREGVTAAASVSRASAGSARRSNGSSTGDRFRGAHEFSIEMDGSAVAWMIDRRKQGVKRAALADRLRGQESLVGSVTIFTNGEVVLYAVLEVAGELDPRWVDERLAETARREFRAATAAEEAARRE